MNEDHLFWGCLTITIILLIIAIIALILIGDTFAEQCAAAGNVLLTDSDLNVGLDTNLDIVFVSETDRICVTPEGAVVSID